MSEPSVQELKSERVQEESLARMTKRLTGQDDAVGAAMAATDEVLDLAERLG